MSIFKRFDKARTAGKYFNEANKYWKRAKQPFIAEDEFTLARKLVEVIRNCQLAIAEDENHGDAYVLLADALLLAGVSEPIKANKERSWYLVTRAAAVIDTWYTLPNRGYPVTKNLIQGEKLFRTILDIVNAGELEAQKDPMKLINSYREQYAKDTISQKGLEEISDVLLNRFHLKDAESTRTPNQVRPSYQWLEETLLPANYDFLLKVVHGLVGAPNSLQIDHGSAGTGIEKSLDDLHDSLLIINTTEEISNRLRDAYEQEDWRQMLGWLIDVRFIDSYRRKKPGCDESLLMKVEKKWAELLVPTINGARRSKDLDTMILAIGYNHYLDIDEVAMKLLEEVRNEIGEDELMLRMQNISENPIMIHEEATIKKTREFMNAS
jgi:hypothetical protein